MNVPTPTRPKFRADLLERAGWTGAEAAAAAITVSQLGLPQWLIVPAAIALAALKGLIAKHTGTKGTASTVPGV